MGNQEHIENVIRRSFNILQKVYEQQQEIMGGETVFDSNSRILFPKYRSGETRFSEQELNTLGEVLTKMQPMSTQEVIDKSHEEDAWKQYRDGNQLIPYSEAFSLRLM